MRQKSKARRLMLKNAEYETTLPRAVLALGLGAVVGALLVSAWMIASELGQPVPTLTAAIDGAAWAFRYGLAIWGAGLVIVAPIPWLILHRGHYRTWLVAAMLGAVLAFFIALIAAVPFLVDVPQLMHGYINTRELFAAFSAAGVCGVAGAIDGIVVWRAAYFRHTDAAERQPQT
jgi:hypothetical protein